MLKKKNIRVHRFALEQALGRPLKGIVMHICDNPTCFNPAHLREGTPKENSLDMVLKERSAFGERQGLSKLDLKKVREILKSKVASETLGPRYGVSGSTIRAVRRGAVWSKALRAKDRKRGR